MWKFYIKLWSGNSLPSLKAGYEVGRSSPDSGCWACQVWMREGDCKQVGQNGWLKCSKCQVHRVTRYYNVSTKFTRHSSMNIPTVEHMVSNPRLIAKIDDQVSSTTIACLGFCNPASASPGSSSGLKDRYWLPTSRSIYKTIAVFAFICILFCGHPWLLGLCNLPQSTPVRCSKITATESAAKKLECNSSFSNVTVHLHETNICIIISKSGIWGKFVFGS